MDKRTHITRVIYEAGETVQYDCGCIEGEPEIAKIPVYPGHTPEAITGNDTSDKVIGEGTITYDVRFYAVTPDEQRIRLLINIEAQKDYYPAYDSKRSIVGI